MPQERSLAALRADIDREIAATLDSEAADGLSPAREVMAESDDRWYGLLLARSADSVAGTPAPDRVLPAATAIEFLRGYCRLRTELLVQFDDATARSPTRDPTAALLAGDYLYSTAYAALDAVDDDRVRDCFGTLLSVSGTIVEALGSGYAGPTAGTDPESFVDGTAGVLGEGAAVIGATLADVDDALRDSFATLGRGLGTSRQIRRALDADGVERSIVPPELDEQRLRRRARRRLDDAERALTTLSSAVDVTPLLAFRAASTPGGTAPTG